MKKLTWLPIILALASAAPCTPEETSKPTVASLASEYTKLTRPPCRTTNVQAEGGNSEQVCPGIYGYKLLLLDSDGRMSVTIVTPDGTQHPLEFWNSVTSHFSTVGRKAEWRIRKQRTQNLPVGIILPLDVKEDPESNTATSYLVVARIDHTNVCVVQKFRSGPSALTDARRVADSAADRSCQTQ
jgi:hypothetical protein